MLLLDAAIQMNPAVAAGIALDHSRRIDDGELRRVGLNAEVVARDHADNGEQGPAGLPALAAATGVVVGDVAFQCDNDLVGWAVAAQSTTWEVRVAPSDAVIDQRVKRGGHGDGNWN